jgi:hypothetical protein
MERISNFNGIINLFIERFGDDPDASSKNKSLESIWDLGDLVKREIIGGISFEEFISSIVPQIIIKTGLKRNTIHRNLRVSHKVVKLYPKKQEWLKVASKIGTFKKLKLLESLLNPDYRKKNGIPDEEINSLMERIEGIKGEELAEITKKIHRTYIKLYFDIDYDIIWECSESINAILKEAIDIDDLNFKKKFRTNYPKTRIDNIRLFFSMIKNEEVFEKQQSRFISFNFIDELSDSRLANFNEDMNQLLKELIKAEKSDRMQREKMRSEIPISWLSQISTRLKALSDDQEFERYKFNESILNKVLEGNSKKA